MTSKSGKRVSAESPPSRSFQMRSHYQTTRETGVMALTQGAGYNRVQHPTIDERLSARQQHGTTTNVAADCTMCLMSGRMSRATNTYSKHYVEKHRDTRDGKDRYYLESRAVVAVTPALRKLLRSPDERPAIGVKTDGWGGPEVRSKFRVCASHFAIRDTETGRHLEFADETYSQQRGKAAVRSWTKREASKWSS